MNARRVPALVVVLVAAVLLVVVGASKPTPRATVFTELGDPTQPFVPRLDFVTSSWFCPGAPVAPAGSDPAGTGGEVVVANPADVPLSGRITVFTDATDTAGIAKAFQVEPRQSSRIELTAIQPAGTYVSALVEITEGGGFVEQVARTPAGAAVAPCSNSTSDHWYFADGFTAEDSTEDLVVTNPFPGDAIVDFSFATVEGSRSPAALQGFRVKGNSVSVIQVDTIVRDDVVIAAHVSSSRGRVIVGRAENFAGATRTGFTMALGAPSLTGQYYFADGEVGEGIAERYSVYNPSDAEVTVQAVFLGLDNAANPDGAGQEITIPAGGVTVVDTAQIPELPAGRHGAVFSATSEVIVVERSITRPAGEGRATTVVMGQPGRFAGNRWSMAVGTNLLIPDVLVVLNVDSLAATVTVKALGPGGEVAVPGLEELALAGNGVITIDLADASALERPLVVESTSRVFVERLLPRSTDLRGRSGSFALPG